MIKHPVNISSAIASHFFTTSIVIRCDASLSIGSGHVMRCRTLARELKGRGANITFLCRRQPGDLISLLEKEFHVLSLPAQPLSLCEQLDGRDLYSAWLGCTQEQDAAQCLDALKENGILNISWLLVDHYGLDSIWESLLIDGLSASDSATRLLAIDDLADRPHIVDILLDQNFFGQTTDQRYQGLVPSNCCKLLGPRYALLGREYSILHPIVPPRTDLHRVLIYFGGVDFANLTGMTLQALASPDLARLAVDVVLGVQSPHYGVINEIIKSRPLTYLHHPLPSLAGLITRADLAIGAGGATTWERICLGLPSIIVASADNQILFNKALHEHNYINYIGHVSNLTTQTLASKIRNFCDNYLCVPQIRNHLVDGNGVSRIGDRLISTQLS